MKFDIKDVKSWANRHDVKVGDEGYFFHAIDILKGSESECLKPIKSVLFTLRNNYAKCFKIELGHDGDAVFEFFLPLNAVKEDKPKKYRPFKTYDEFNDFLDTCSYLRETYISFRNKKTHHIYNDLIFSVSYDVEGELFSINRFSVQELFDNFEIYKFGEWVPFGVEVQDED